MSFHPRGGERRPPGSTTTRWLDFNMQQTGHGLAGRGASPGRGSQQDYERTPVEAGDRRRAALRGPPAGVRVRGHGYSFDAHVRQRAYWDVFSGACGHTYGNHAVWQMYAPGRKPINGPLMYWNEAIQRPGATQMQYVRALIESRPYFSRVPDQLRLS